jgi:excisionase family DNA binding protein
MNVTHPGAATLAPLFVDVREAAQLLGFGTTKTWAMVNSGEIPSRRFGKSVRIPLAALRQLADVDHPAAGAEF